MKMFLGLTRRNLLLYFKDRQAILFSLLTSMIIFVLYLLFLRRTFADAVSQAAAAVPALQGLIRQEDLDMFTNMKLLVGVLASAMITIPYSCLMTVIRDRENHVDQDILATPVRRGQIILSYFTASALSAILMAFALLTAGLGLLRFFGALSMGPADILRAYGVTALGCLSSAALFLTVLLFFRTSAASTSFFGILSAVSGFVIGAYIPISQFSDRVQTVCNLFPASHITVLLRNALLGGVLERIDAGIGGLDGGEFTAVLRDAFSFRARLFGSPLALSGSLVYVLAFFALSLGVMVILFSRKYQKK